VLTVEDDPVTARLILSVVERSGCLHAAASSLEDAHRLLRVWPADVVILDLDLPDGSGLDLLRTLRSEGWHPEPAVLVSSGISCRDTVQAALEEGVRDFVLKPVDGGELAMRLERVLQDAPRPWEPLDGLLKRLAVTSGAFLEILRRARSTLAELRGEALAAGSPELLDSLMVRCHSLGGAIGNRALQEALDCMCDPAPTRDADALARILERESRRVELLLRSSEGGTRGIEVPASPEAASAPAAGEAAGASSPAPVDGQTGEGEAEAQSDRETESGAAPAGASPPGPEDETGEPEGAAPVGSGAGA
jgi:DNA-binding response OmpR family regulator